MSAQVWDKFRIPQKSEQARKFRNLKYLVGLLCLALIISMSPIFATDIYLSQVIVAGPDQVIVTSPEGLKTAMENPQGSNVKLGANIVFPSSHRSEEMIVIPSGRHFLDLNGYNIEYYYKNASNEYDGVPITIRTGQLTINGPGGIKGGYVALHSSGWDNVVTINGGTFIGLAATSLWVRSLAIINGGSFQGRFGPLFNDEYLVVDNIGFIKDINKVSGKNKGILLKNGDFTGTATLHGPLSLPRLNMNPGSSIEVGERGCLNVLGAVTGSGKVTEKGGILAIGGTYTINKDRRFQEDVSLHNLNVNQGAFLQIHERSVTHLTGDLNNKGRLEIDETSYLIVDGNLVNDGPLICRNPSGLIVKGDIMGKGSISDKEEYGPGGPAGGPNGQGDGHGNGNGQDQGFGNSQDAANKLYKLGLFQGTGKTEKGEPIFDLDLKPNRMVGITMLVRLLGKEKEALSSKYKHPFKDVDSWADPYVGYAYEKGLTKGVSDTSFGAKDLTNQNQYLTFLLRALGYNDSRGDFSWKEPAILGHKIGLAEKDTIDDKAPFLRGDVANLSLRTLGINLKTEDISLLQVLINSGAVSKEDAKGAGLY